MTASPEIRQEYLSCLQALKRADVVAHDIKDDLKQGGVMAVTEVMRRMTSGSEDILGHCVARGMNPGCSDRKLIVVVFEILREFEGYRSPLSVDHYLKPGQYLKGKFQVIQKFARYLKTLKDKDLSHAESRARPHKRLSELAIDTVSSRSHRGQSPTRAMPYPIENLEEEYEEEEYEDEDESFSAGSERERVTEPGWKLATNMRLGQKSAIYSDSVPSRRLTHTGAMNTHAANRLETEYGSPHHATNTPRGHTKSPNSSPEKPVDAKLKNATSVDDNNHSDAAHDTSTGQIMKDMSKHFSDTQSMMRMILSLSKRIRSLEDYGSSPYDTDPSSSLMHTAPHKRQQSSQSQSQSQTQTPIRGIHASSAKRAATYRDSTDSNPNSNNKISLEETIYGALEDNKASFSESGTEGSPSKQAKVNSPSQGTALPSNGIDEQLGTAYIDLLFSLLEKKMKANLEKEMKTAINSAVAASEKRSAEQMKLLVSEIDKIHGNFDKRLTKLETTTARDRMEKRMEEQEMSKLIANSTYSPTSNIARFRMSHALSNAGSTSTSKPS